MKIVHVAHNYFPGIGLAAMYEYCLHESKLGLEVSAIVLGNQKRGLVEENHDGIHLYKIASNNISARSVKKITFIFKAVRILKDVDCDIVHVYSNIGLGLIPLLVGTKRKKWIYDIRSGPVYPGLSRKIGLIALRIESHFFNLCTASSSGTKNMVFPGNKSNIPIFSLGVNFDRFKRFAATSIRNQYNIRPDQILVIFTGTLHPTRRLAQIVRAMVPIKAVKEIDVVLLILGDGSDRNNLIKLTRLLGLEENIIIPGSINFDQIPRYLNAADIGLAYVPNTAEYGPQPSLKAVEMLACELPVVATNTEGNRMLIENGVNGVLIEDNYKAIADAIIDLCNHKSEAEKYRSIARKSIQKYDYQTIVRETILPVYEDLLRN